MTATQAIAFDLDQTAYDSLYLALALAGRDVRLTADAALPPQPPVTRVTGPR